MAITYKDAGVDIDAGERLVERIGPVAAKTRRPEVLGGLGGFAGACRVPAGYQEPILVSGTDGVGTKLKSALATGRHRGVGIDLVAMCVNDIAVVGAEPLFFLDYFATAALDVDVAAEVISGVADGCSEAGCALLGGETAELPGMYQPGDYDLAGFCVGVVERAKMRDGTRVEAGDRILGLASVGLHSNGHSLARRAILEELKLDFDATPDLLGGSSIADELTRPTRIYSGALLALDRGGVSFHGAAHITGGGLIDNPPRMLGGRELSLTIDTSVLGVPPVFDLIASAGVAEEEMRRTFNLGIGMVIAVAPADETRALELLAAHGERAAVVGEVTSGPGRVEFA